jgi:hypothetical protein
VPLGINEVPSKEHPALHRLSNAPLDCHLGDVGPEDQPPDVLMKSPICKHHKGSIAAADAASGGGLGSHHAPAGRLVVCPNTTCVHWGMVAKVDDLGTNHHLPCKDPLRIWIGQCTRKQIAKHHSTNRQVSTTAYTHTPCILNGTVRVGSPVCSTSRDSAARHCTSKGCPVM